MSQPTEAAALLRAVLLENCGSDAAARRHLVQADRLGVDPLDYCAHRFGLGNALVWQRAAGWAGLAFAGTTPSRLPAPRIDRLEHLGHIRSFRQMVLGTEMVFIAPHFAQLLRLRNARPELKRHTRIVPPEAIEAGLTRAASAQLMDEARQRLTRLWPRASASQDLPLHARATFVTALAALIGLVMAAGLIAGPLLVPVVAGLLMAPGLMRLLAAFPSRRRQQIPALPTDAELPPYTVLIPLRDEAAMVPMLAHAMSALDYPVLWSSHT